jgi:hypothetical protein
MAAPFLLKACRMWILRRFLDNQKHSNTSPLQFPEKEVQNEVWDFDKNSTQPKFESTEFETMRVDHR